LLITSRDTGRWVIPKGWPMDGLCPHEAAKAEAWEEAGVKGEIANDSIGLYSYDKMMGPAAPLPCVVAVYALRVTGLADRFPEAKQRQRKWFSADKAARLVAERDLRTLLAGLTVTPTGLTGPARDNPERRKDVRPDPGGPDAATASSTAPTEALES